MPPALIYCLDTSSAIEWFVRAYPPSILPNLPLRMEALIAAGRLRAPKAVLDELTRIDDDCCRWAKAQTGFFLEESVEVQRIVRQLMATHRNPAKPQKGISVQTLLLSRWRKPKARTGWSWPTSIPAHWKTGRSPSCATPRKSAASPSSG